jgi:uncharacterized membrane protein YhaH (DUF805 family)
MIGRVEFWMGMVMACIAVRLLFEVMGVEKWWRVLPTILMAVALIGGFVCLLTNGM